MEVDTREIYRYLGASHSDGVLDSMVSRAQREMEAAAHPKHTSRLLPIEAGKDAVTCGGIRLESQALAQHLAGCQQAFLFACTLGPGVDRLIKRYSITEMPMVPVLQACSAAYIEAYADKAQLELEEYTKGQGLYLRPRYSPGYGDFPLSYQTFLFSALDIPQKLGVALTENFLMVPCKSITAVIGLSPDPSLCHIHKCMTCSAENCPFRKETLA